MNNEELSINLLFPVLNERLRLQSGIDRTMAYMKENVAIPYCLTILDNGSDDETPEIGKALAEKYPEVSYVRVGERGVGVAFRKGIELNECALVGYMDIDLSTDIKYLGRTIDLFRERPELEYVNGSRFSKESDTKGRKWYRKITSMGLVFLLKTIFHMKATDAVCGFTFLRKETAERLVAASGNDNGWFYTIEFLLRAERMGVVI
ncbi:MAG: glycosyltransferase, partial [Clostridiales bacterium]|nr:glycosyltransferase [Clostridiales bacterium]